MNPSSSVQFYTQFCPRCGNMFIRLEKLGAKPTECGECRYTRTLATISDNNGQRDYAEVLLAKWYAEQAAFVQASGLAVSKALQEALSLLHANTDEVPF